MRISDCSADVCSSDLNGDGLFLADDALVQRLLHEDETRGLLLGELEHGDAGRGSENLGDDSLIDHAGRSGLAVLPLLLEAQPLAEQLLLFVAQRSEEHTSELQSLMRLSYAGFC